MATAKPISANFRVSEDGGGAVSIARARRTINRNDARDIVSAVSGLSTAITHEASARLTLTDELQED